MDTVHSLHRYTFIENLLRKIRATLNRSGVFRSTQTCALESILRDSGGETVTRPEFRGEIRNRIVRFYNREKKIISFNNHLF